MASENTNKTPNKSRKKNIIRLTCAVLVLVMLMVGITYAWIRRQWRPTLYSDEGITIEVDGALAFRMDDKIKTLVSVNEILGMNDFVLKPVSNLSGKSEDFFGLDKSSPGYERFFHIVQTSNQSWTDIGKTYGYFEATFYILGNVFSEDDDIQPEYYDEYIEKGYKKYVFLNGGLTKILNRGEDHGQADATRVSITIDDKTYIFRNKTEDDAGQTIVNRAITNRTLLDSNNDKYWIADGAAYGTENVIFNGESYPLVESIPKVYSFSDFNGGFTFDPDTGEILNRENAELNKEKCLFTLDPTEEQTVTVRIWLEGEDPECTKEIAGKMLDLVISFDCVNILN